MPALGIGDRLRDLLSSRRFHWAITIAFGVVVVLYFAFVTFLFDPFEDDLEDMAAIVERDVDWFFRWRGIAERFDPFPEPVVWQRFEESPIHARLAGGGQLEEWDRSLGLSEIRQVLDRVVEQVPPGLSLEDDLLREVAVVGRGPIGFDSDFDGMVMLRVSFKVKAGVAFLDYGFVRDRLPASLGIASLGQGRYRLPQFEPFGFQDAYLARIRDVLLLSTSEEWLDRARNLLVTAGEGSLATSSVFYDNVTAYLDEADQPVEIFLRYERLREQLGRWPDPASDAAWERALNRFVDSGILRYLAGYLRPGDRFEARFTGETDVSKATDFQRGWYESAPLEVSRLKKFAEFVPADSFFYGAISGDPARVLIQLEGTLDEELRRLLDEAVVQSGQYQGMAHLLQEIGASINPGLYLAMRRFEYAPDPRDVPNDGSAMPVFCVFATLRDSDRFAEIEEFFRLNYARFTDREDVRATTVQLRGGGEVLSFASRAIPGTGELLIGRVPAANAVVFGNSYRYMEQLMETYFIGPREARVREKLSASEGFQEALEGLVRGRGSANLFLYLQPDEAAYYFDQLARDLALERFLMERRESWAPRRPAVEAAERSRLFPGKPVLNPAEEAQLEEAVIEALRREDRAEEERLLPAYTEAERNRLLPLQALVWGAASLKVDRKRAEFLLGGRLDFE